MTDDVTLLTVKELQAYLRIGKDKVYALTKYKDFPSIRIGRRILIPKERLNVWLNRHMFQHIDV